MTDDDAEFLVLQLYSLKLTTPPATMEMQMAALERLFQYMGLPSRRMFHEIATERYGWSEVDFAVWAGTTWPT